MSDVIEIFLRVYLFHICLLDNEIFRDSYNIWGFPISFDFMCHITYEHMIERGRRVYCLECGHRSYTTDDYL